MSTPPPPPQDPPDLPRALLKWVQALQPSEGIASLSELRDGQTIYRMLQDIDPDYFTDPLPEALDAINGSGSSTTNIPSSPSSPSSRRPRHQKRKSSYTISTTNGNLDLDSDSNWISHWQNLKHLSKAIGAYMRDVCGTLEEARSDTVPDLKMIAQRGSEGDVVLLLMNVLKAAMWSPRSNMAMGRVLVGLGPEAAKPIAAALAAMEGDGKDDEVDEDDGYGGDGDGEGDVFGEDELEVDKGEGDKEIDATSGNGRAVGLEEEEKLIRAHRIIRQLEDNSKKLATELEGLRVEKKTLEDKFESFRFDVENNAKPATDSDQVRELQTRAERDRDHIAELEADLENVRETTQTQKRQLDRFTADTDAKQALRDDLQVLRAERDELLQKNRANENLKKKIQTLQDQERLTSSLRDELKTAQTQLQSLDGLKEQCAALQKANAENMNLIANGEQEIFDQKTSRKRLEHEYQLVVQRYDAAKERQTRDHDTIAELEARLSTLEGVDIASPSAERGGLDSELDASDEAARSAAKRGSVSGHGSADTVMVQERLQAILARNNRLETDYLDMLHDKLGLETTVDELLRGPSREDVENVPFLEQRKKLQTAQADLARLKETHFASISALNQTKEKLLAYGDGDVELDAESEYHTLTERYADLFAHAGSVDTELGEYKALLRHALLNPAAAAREDREVREGNEYKVIVQRLWAVRKAGTDQDYDHDNVDGDADDTREGDEAVEKLIDGTAVEIVSRIEEGRKQREEMAQRAEASDATILELKRQVEDRSRQPVSTPKDMANLQRENALVTSAWYDLAARVQTNTVSLGRRKKESPRSWLGKQRELVGLGGGGGGRVR